MRSWLASGGQRLSLSRLERDFVDASVAQADAEAIAARRRTRRLRALVAATSVLAVLAAVSAVLAVDARSAALQARDEALSRQVALTADRLADVDPTLAAQLAVVGYGISPTSEARSALLDAAANPTAVRVLGGAGSTSLAVAEDGALVAVGDPVASHVQLLTRREGQVERAAVVPLTDPEAETFALALVPDRESAARRRHRRRHHDLGRQRPRRTHPARCAPGRSRRSDPGARRPPWWPGGRSCRARRRRLPLGHHRPRGAVASRAAALGPHHLVGGLPPGRQPPRGRRGRRRGRPLGPRRRPRRAASVSLTDRSILAVAFAPDGSTLAVGSRTGDLGVWDLSDLEAPAPVEVADATFDSWLNTLAFDPDGGMLAAGSSDGALRLYSTARGPHATASRTRPRSRPPRSPTVAARSSRSRPTAPPGSGTSRATCPSRSARRSGASASRRTGRSSRPSPRSTPGCSTPPTRGGSDHGSHRSPSPRASSRSAAGERSRRTGRCSPTARVAATCSSTASPVRVPTTVWRSGAPRVWSRWPRSAQTVRCSPLAAGTPTSGCGSSQRTGPASLVAVLDEPAENVLNVAFSADGRLLAAASADEHVHLYDLAEPDAPRALARLGGFDSEAYAAAFSPDGRVLATAGTDAVVLLWDLSDPDEPQRIGGPIGGPPGRIFDLAFDAAGTRLAAAVADGSTWVWDTSDLEVPSRHAVLGPSPGPIYAVRFGPGGETPRRRRRPRAGPPLAGRRGGCDRSHLRPHRRPPDPDGVGAPPARTPLRPTLWRLTGGQSLASQVPSRRTSSTPSIEPASQSTSSACTPP
jgi:hypothetical protein